MTLVIYDESRRSNLSAEDKRLRGRNQDVAQWLVAAPLHAAYDRFWPDHGELLLRWVETFTAVCEDEDGSCLIRRLPPVHRSDCVLLPKGRRTKMHRSPDP
jgi:hypothetical protein